MTSLLYIISQADSLFGQSIVYAHNKRYMKSLHKHNDIWVVLHLIWPPIVLFGQSIGDRVNSVQLGQYHGCWCPGSLRRQDISSHDIDYVE